MFYFQTSDSERVLRDSVWYKSDHCWECWRGAVGGGGGEECALVITKTNNKNIP